MYLTKFATNWYIPFVIPYNMCIDIMISKNGKVFKAITSRDAKKNDAKQTRKVFKYQNESASLKYISSWWNVRMLGKVGRLKQCSK